MWATEAATAFMLSPPAKLSRTEHLQILVPGPYQAAKPYPGTLFWNTRAPLDYFLPDQGVKPLLLGTDYLFPVIERITVHSLTIIKVRGCDAFVIIKDAEKSRPGFVTGKVDPGDTDIITAYKETYQEAGIPCSPERFHRIGFVHHKQGQGNTQIAVFFLSISREEASILRAGDEQAWLKLATRQQIENALRHCAILPNHAEAWRKFTLRYHYRTYLAKPPIV